MNGRAATLILLFVLAALECRTADAQPTRYVWRNVTLGGGGFSPSLIFSRVAKDLAYLRTDIGGVYRWDAAHQQWLPLQDDFSESNYMGVESIAPDPVQADVVYAAVGMYRFLPAAILRSSDRGNHWSVYPTSFRMGGNEDGRGVGERLAIDPNDNSILYFGSRHDGLQRSADRGRTWQQVASFPQRGLGLLPGGPTHAGISFVVFDAASGNRKSRSNTIFVGVADPGKQHLYRSDDAGLTWQAVPQQPREDWLPLQAQLDQHGKLYITYGNGAGPNGVTSGAVYALDTRRNQWTDITPDKTMPSGYMGLSLDRQRPGTLVVATLNRWRSGDVLWRSTDGGTSWHELRSLSIRDVSATPFLTWGEEQAHFGWWMAGVAIDPFDSNHLAYTTGATVYATRELKHADETQSIAWRPWITGVEETAVITLASPPVGPHLLSGFGDIGGYAHTELSISPPMFANPTFDNTNIVDFASRAPHIVVRSGAAHRPAPDAVTSAATLAWSNDSGKTWSPLQTPASNASGLSNAHSKMPITVTADGANFIVMTPAPLISRDRGVTWSEAQGLPSPLRVIADREAAQHLYALDFVERRLYVSEDGGLHFTARDSTGLPAELRDFEPRNIETPWPLIAAPGRAGELWFNAGGELYRSQNAGRSFERIDSTLKVQALGFGKSRRSDDVSTLFAIGIQDGVRAIWRSDDSGAHWLRINDTQHEYGRRFRCISGDPRIYGRVYVGTDGRGIVYGDIASM